MGDWASARAVLAVSPYPGALCKYVEAEWISVSRDTARLGNSPAERRSWLRILVGVDPSLSSRIFPRAKDKEAGAIVSNHRKIWHDPHDHDCQINLPGWLVLHATTPSGVESPGALRGRFCPEPDIDWLNLVAEQLTEGDVLWIG